MTDSSDSETMAAKLQELREAVDEEDFGTAISLCEGLLKGDNDASLERVVFEIYIKALLHEKQYDKVLGLSPPSSLAEHVSLLESHKAYAYYRLEQYDKAIQLTQKLSGTPDDPSAEHIQAQALFHLNDTPKALQSYQDLMHQGTPASEGEEDNHEFWTELYTNTMAVLTANATPYNAYDLTLSQRDKAYNFLQKQTDEFPYDLAYNIASHDLLAADTMAARQQAIALLNQAQKACKETLADEQAQLKQELQPIQINLQWGKTFWGEDAPGSTPSSAVTSSAKLNSLLEYQINPVLLQESSSKKTTEKTIQALESLLQGETIKLTALQKRLCRYNMAVLQLRIQDYEACQQTLEALSQSLMVPKKKSNKKPKVTAAVIPPPSEVDTLWWQVRADVLLAYALSMKLKYSEGEADQEDKQVQDLIQKLKNRLEKVKTLMDGSKDASSGKLLEHTHVYLLLHLQQLTAQEDFSAEEQFQWLQSFCSGTNKTYPAVTATLAKAFQDRNQPDKAKELLLKGGDGNRIIAEMAMTQENYAEAVSLYSQALDTDPTNHGIRARLVEALAHVEPAKALAEWKKIESAIQEYDWEDEDDDEEEDGEALEMRELPRIKHSSTTDQNANVASGTSTANAIKTNKKSQESILRRRTKLREAHLEQLQQKGLYNPSRPTQPDPERWIPKHERQRRRRGRGAQNKASQGGVSAKDAAKLDVAARAAGVDTGNSGRSTAHLSVAGGSRKGGRRR